MGVWPGLARLPPAPRRRAAQFPSRFFWGAYFYILDIFTYAPAPAGRARAGGRLNGSGTYQAYISAYLHIGRWRQLAGRWPRHRPPWRQPAGRRPPPILHNRRYAFCSPVMQMPLGQPPTAPGWRSAPLGQPPTAPGWRSAPSAPGQGRRGGGRGPAMPQKRRKT